MSNDSLKKIYQATKLKLDTISSSFCLAKWLQVTLHLQIGRTHSCHSPQPHIVPFDELNKSPSNLHNTNHKKKAREEMLNNVRPSECDYCWKMEDIPGEHFSDRIIKSNDNWALPYFNEVISSGRGDKINPKYLEISFSNLCNFKCVYCFPDISSRWQKDLQQFGSYPSFNKYHQIPEKDHFLIQDTSKNPYVKSFWEWWPDLYKDLNVIRITGGEPLLIKDTFKILDYIISNPKHDLSLAINSNLGADQKFIERFFKKIKIISEKNKVKDITIYTSLDTWGKEAEYIRSGLNLENFDKNIHLILSQLPKVKITIMCTFNILPITNFRSFLDYVLALKAIRQQAPSPPQVILDISQLEYPHFFNINLATKDLLEIIKSDLNYMHANSIKLGKEFGFTDYELNKMERIYKYVKSSVLENSNFKKITMAVFHNFINEFDRRTGTNFLEAFPAYTDFYNRAKAYSKIFRY